MYRFYRCHIYTAVYIYLDTKRKAFGAYVRLENRNLIVKLLCHFGNQICFSRSPSATTTHSD